MEYRPRDEEGYCVRLAATRKYPGPLVAKIEDDLACGLSVMVLASCAYMLAPTIALLRKEAIPFHNPYRRSNGAWNPLYAGPKRISSSQRLLAFLSSVDLDAGGWRRDALVAWLSAVKVTDVARPKAKERLEAMPPLLSYDQVSSVLTEQAIRAVMLSDVEWFQSQLLAGYHRRMTFPAAIYERRGADALRDDPEVTVGTCHSVKGGEADVVYLFPDLSPRGVQEWVGSAEQRASVYRLMYVGMTRARHTLRLCAPASRLSVGGF